MASRRGKVWLIATITMLVATSCRGGGDAGSTSTTPQSASTASPTTGPAPAASTTAATPPAIDPTTTSPSAPAFADLVLRGGNLLTMTTPATASAVAISGDRIIAIGGVEIDDLIGPDTTVVELDGATVMPGLVDTHSHFYSAGLNEGLGPDIADTMLAAGITTTAELHVDDDLLTTLQRYESAGELRVRTSAYLIYDDACGNVQDDWWRGHAPTRVPGEMLRIGGVKVFADGGSCNVPAASFAYADGSTGDLYFTADQLAEIIAEIDAAGYQIAIHALGDLAVEAALDAFDQVLVDGTNPRRHRIDHNALVRPDMRGRYDEVGAVAVLFGAIATCFFTDDNNQFRYRTPPEFQGWEWPWRDLLDLNPNTTFAWHADYPVLDPSLGRTLEGFVTRDQGDCVAPPDVAVHGIEIGEALQLMTMGSAYALGRDAEVGSLEPGKFADLLILGSDPLTIPTADLVGVNPLVTIVGGVAEYCDPESASLCPVVPGDGTPAAATTTTPPPTTGNLARGAEVTASNWLPDRPPSAAIDGDDATGWGSGSDASQWIEIDLGGSVEVSAIRLLVDQYPAGRTIHRVLGGSEPNPSEEVGRVDQDTANGDWIEITIDRQVRYVRIETIDSPSWVSWFEIQVI